MSCKICGSPTNSKDPNEHLIGFSCGGGGMTHTSSKRQVKPTFSDIVELVRREYKDGFGVEMGYAKAAALVDNAIKPHLTKALKELKKEAEGLYDKTGGYPAYEITEAVPIEAIDNKIKELEGEK